MSGPDDIEKPSTEDAPRKGRYGPAGRSGRTPPMIDGEALVAPAQSGSVVDEAVLEEAAAASPGTVPVDTIAADAMADPVPTDEPIVAQPAPRRGWMVAAAVAILAAAGGAYAYSEGWLDEAIGPYIGANPAAPVNPTARPGSPMASAQLPASSAPSSSAPSSSAPRADRPNAPSPPATIPSTAANPAPAANPALKPTPPAPTATQSAPPPSPPVVATPAAPAPVAAPSQSATLERPDLEARVADLAKKLDAVEARPVSAPAIPAPAVDLSPLESKLSAIETRIAALEAKLDPPKSSVQALMSREAGPTRAPADEAQAAASRLVIAQALTQSLDSGAPFTQSLAALKSLGANPDNLNALEPLAANGAPTLARLRTDFQALKPRFADPVSVPANESLSDRAMRQLGSLVKVTPIGERAGANPSAQFTQIDAALARNDLAGALALYDKLPDNIRTDTSAWANAARARAQGRCAGAGIDNRRAGGSCQSQNPDPGSLTQRQSRCGE